MAPFKFKLGHSFYQELHDRLEKQRTKYNKTPLRVQFFQIHPSGLRTLIPQDESEELYGPKTIPSIKHLETLVETAFWTSLQREEGRELRFIIKYMPEPWEELTLLFKSPIPFDVSNLRKLAPSLGRVHVGVTASEARGRLEICELTDVIAEPVAIKVLDPGQLIVSFVTSNVAAISGDEPVFIRDELLSWSKDIWSIFAKGEVTKEFSAFSEPRVGAIINIAREMRRAKHGGTLLVVPVGTDITSSIDHIVYEIDVESDNTSDYLISYLEAKRELAADKNNKDIAKRVERAHWRLNVDAPQFIAQLTLVDGATLLSSNLDVKGFGVRIKAASDSPLPYVVRIDPLDHSHWAEQVGTDKLLWGTRHKSAARFVFDNHDSIAVVVSQDGNVTAYVWREGGTPLPAGVNAFERLELTLF